MVEESATIMLVLILTPTVGPRRDRRTPGALLAPGGCGDGAMPGADAGGFGR